MHKLVIIGLLLLTAGLFGVATLNNIFSNVMAQEYDTYQYERYAMGDMVANEYESYRDNYYQEADPDYYSSSYNEDYRSYPSDDTYDKSHDKSNRISSITKNNCINVNNINSGSSTNGELVKAAPATGIEEVEGENSGGRSYDDGYNNKKDSDFDCIINSNNNVGIGEEGNDVGIISCAKEAESCYQQHRDEFDYEGLKNYFEDGGEFPVEVFGAFGMPHDVSIGSFEDICEIINTYPTNDDELRMSLFNILMTLPGFHSRDPLEDFESYELFLCWLDNIKMDEIIMP